MRRALCGLAVVIVLGTAARAQAQVEVAPEAEVVEVERVHRESLSTRRTLANAVLIAGLGSVAAGGALMISDAEDQAFRFAGINTAIFGVVNTVVSLLARHGIAREEDAWESPEASAARRAPGGLARARVHAALDERRESTSHAVNLGLDGAYLAVAGTTILASQLGVDHPNRWLGSGAAIGVQAVFLVGIDFIGLRSASRYHRTFVESLAPSVTVIPSAAGTDTRFSVGGTF